MLVYHYTPRGVQFDIKQYIEQIEFTHRKISEIFNLEFARKTPVFVYYNHNHFLQNRIAPVSSGVQGFCELFKNRMVIPVGYSKYDINHLIAHEYVHIAQFEILYSGFWKSARLVKGLSGLEPLWIMEGMAESVSHRILNRPWSSYDRMILRDAVLYDYLYKLRELQNFSALHTDIYLGYKEAHSAMDYLTEKEGEDVNFRLLKALRNNIDPVKAFEIAAEKFAGLSAFDLKWKKDLKNKVNSFVEGKDKAQDVCDILISDKYNSLNTVPAGNGNFYYVSDRWLTNEIYLHTPEKEIKVLSAFFGCSVRRLVTEKRYDRIIDYNPKMNLLVFIANEKQKSCLFIYNTVTKKNKRIKLDLNEIRSPCISNDGMRIVFTALKDAGRNIYIYEIDSERIVKVTEDEFIDYGPVFSNDNEDILAATERNLNTDLRIINIDTGESKWLTETPYNEIQPVYSESDEIYYSADKNSVYNIYKYEVNNSTSHVITNIRGGAFFPHVDEKGDILCSCYFNNSFKITQIPLPPYIKGGKAGFNDESFEVKTTRAYIKEPSSETLPEDIIIGGKFKKRFSTDFFFPSFLYSTEIGFIGGGYYRASDILSNHNVDLYGWAWPGTYEVSAQYIMRKYRPDIFLSLSSKGEGYLLVSEEKEDEYRESLSECILGYTYPVDSFWSISNWITAGTEDSENITTREKTLSTETGIGVELIRRTALLDPFHVLRGSLFSISAYSARPIEKYAVTYNRYDCSLRKYISFSHRLTLANRLYFARVEGEDREDLKLGSSGGFINIPRYSLRGYSSSSFTGENLGSLSSELRFLLFPRIKGHIYFMWPDINIYSLSIKLFGDMGTCWNDNIDDYGKSWGFGFKLNIYLIQLAPIYINAEFARPVDEPKWKYYWTFSSGYITW